MLCGRESEITSQRHGREVAQERRLAADHLECVSYTRSRRYCKFTLDSCSPTKVLYAPPWTFSFQAYARTALVLASTKMPRNRAQWAAWSALPSLFAVYSTVLPPGSKAVT